MRTGGAFGICRIRFRDGGHLDRTGVLLLTFLILGDPEKKGEQDTERSFVDALYRLGNAMLGGQDLDRAFEEVSRTEHGAFRDWGLRMVHATRTDRISLVEATRADRDLSSHDPVLHQNYLAVMACAEEDHLGAGKLAVNLAKPRGMSPGHRPRSERT